jgi:hypothetical protein
LRATLERLFADEFPERILPFDLEAALVCPKIVIKRAQVGATNVPVGGADCVRMPAVQCDARHPEYWDFEDCGLTIINACKGK